MPPGAKSPFERLLEKTSASLSRVRTALLPTAGADPQIRADFERKMRAATSRNLRFVVPLLLPQHVVAIVLFARTPAPTSVHAEWLSRLVMLHAAMGAFGVVAGILTWTRLRSDARWLGELAAAVYVVGGALFALNSQRVHPNMNIFVLAVFGTAFALNTRPRWYLATLAAGAAIVVASIERFAVESGARAGDRGAAIVVATVAAMAYLVTRAGRFREHVAQREIERMNVHLEDRVQDQVREIVTRAQEIEHLNTQLNEKVRERSRELSTALARLAQGHAPLEAGTILGDRVQIEDLLAEGGMGAVYRARDLVTGRTVAVKVVQAGSVNELESLHRFLREARVMATLTHPGIVRSIHVDVSSDGQLFQVMELVVGQTLQRILDERHDLPVPVVARMGSVLADSLASAHAAGVIHRDVKPSNVMLTAVAPGLKLLDFGISRVREAAADDPALTEGQVIGTPQFLAPEQVNDPGNVGDAADVYCLGLVLYVSLTGSLPFNAESTRTWLLVHALQDPADLKKRAPHVPDALARLVMSCLEKAPQDRPTAKDMATALADIAAAEGASPLEAMGLDVPSLAIPGPGENTAPNVAVTGIQRTSTPARRTLKAAR